MSKNSSIFLGKVIYKTLSEVEELKPILQGRVYPIVAEKSAIFPYVVYYRTSIQNISQNKDGYNEDLYTFEVVILSTKYEESLQIANLVRNSLEKKKLRQDNLQIESIKLTDGEEGFNENTYIQKLVFQATITN